jgi:hypothetical protein
MHKFISHMQPEHFYMQPLKNNCNFTAYMELIAYM